MTLFPKRHNNNPSERINAGDIVYMRYRDHVLFRNTNHALYKPALRETVGWLQKESTEAVWILWERSLEPLPHERNPAKESGLVLLKSDVIEIRRLPLQDFLDWLLCRASALTSNRRICASEQEAKNSAKVEEKANANR